MAAICMAGVGGVNSLAVRRSATARPVRGRDLRACCREGRRAWSPGVSQWPVDPASECRRGRLDLVLTFIRAGGCTEDDASRWASAWRMIALRTINQAAKDQAPNDIHMRTQDSDFQPTYEDSRVRWSF